MYHDNGKGKREVLQVFFSPTKAVKQRETWSESEYRLAVPLAPSHPPSFPLPPLDLLSSVLDLPIFRLGLE